MDSETFKVFLKTGIRNKWITKGVVKGRTR